MGKKSKKSKEKPVAQTETKRKPKKVEIKKEEIILFNFSSYEKDWSDDQTFCTISAFLIDAFKQTRDVFVFYTLCQYVGQKYMSFETFLSAVQADVKNFAMVEVDTLDMLQACYEVYVVLPR